MQFICLAVVILKLIFLHRALRENQVSQADRCLSLQRYGVVIFWKMIKKATAELRRGQSKLYFCLPIRAPLLRILNKLFQTRWVLQGLLWVTFTHESPLVDDCDVFIASFHDIHCRCTFKYIFPVFLVLGFTWIKSRVVVKHFLNESFKSHICSSVDLSDF